MVPGAGTRKAEIRVNQKLERLLVSSRYMRQNLLTNGFSADKVEVLPPFVSVDSPESPTVPSHTVLFASRLELNKGTLLLPGIAKLLLPQAKLIVAGEGELKEELQKATSSTGQNGKLVFRGWLTGETFSLTVDVSSTSGGIV